MTTAEDTVREFWRLMATNDFRSVARVLADTFVLEWPQSNERIRGATHFALMNEQYPADGPWRFTLHRVVAAEREVVTWVSVTDGRQAAQALSIFDVDDGRITRLVEFWPERTAAPAQRAHLTEPMEGPQSASNPDPSPR